MNPEERNLLFIMHPRIPTFGTAGLDKTRPTKIVTLMAIYQFILRWRRLHNEELRNFHVSPNVIRVVKSKSMK